MQTYVTTKRFIFGRRHRPFWWAICVPFVLCVPTQASQLAPDTRLRLTVVHWMPIEGEFHQWDALSGEFQVSPDGTISVPVVGSIPVEGMSTDELAAEIARLLQSKMGLIDPPDASVAIIEQPPVYVVGAVTNPGQYTFRQGLTVLQALALGGGTLRSDDVDASSGRIQLLSDLQDLGNDIVRTSVRIARLEAELSEASEITLPAGMAGPGSPVGEIMNQEKTVFVARASALTRQSASLAELGELYDAEINVLQTKITNLDDSIAIAEQDLERISALVDQGMATVSRKTDLQQLLGNMRADRLDQVTATMRARQYLNEAQRNMTTLRDQRRTEIAQELLTEQSDLERLHLHKATSQRLLQELDRKLLLNAATSDAQPTMIAFTVVRTERGESREFEALETTELLPGDVVRVVLSQPEQTSSSLLRGSYDDAQAAHR